MRRIPRNIDINDLESSFALIPNAVFVAAAARAAADYAVATLLRRRRTRQVKMATQRLWKYSTDMVFDENFKANISQCRRAIYLIILMYLGKYLSMLTYGRQWANFIISCLLYFTNLLSVNKGLTEEMNDG